jgi:methyltransferase (TIGR00027 family)
MVRAIASGSEPWFSDATAMALLPETARTRAERVRAGGPPSGPRDALVRAFLKRQSKVMIARTVEIDEAVRRAASPQVVILGAGLDGRAWRMTELSKAVVFEVDHPDSQRDKRARVPALRERAREVRFVAVDFARDDLDDALRAAGHDPTVPTTWIWEGVVMYLERRDIEATLAVVQRRSARGSEIAILYHRPAFVLRLVRPVMRWVGEPFRSAFRPGTMHAMLAQYGFDVQGDRSIAEIGRALSPEMGKATSVASHLRIVRATAR